MARVERNFTAHLFAIVTHVTLLTFATAIGKNINHTKIKYKSRQHPDFPGGHPPEYYPSLRLLNFAERTGYGDFSLRWPSTTSLVGHAY